MNQAERPDERRLTDARKPCVLLVLPAEDGDAHNEHYSTEWTVVDDPWLALAEILHQDREAATRAGWGLRPVGRSYLVTVGPIDGGTSESLRAALGRWSPDARLIEVQDSAELARLEQDMSARTTPHPLRRHESIPHAAPEEADDPDSDSNTGEGDAPAPIPLPRTPPVAWSRQFAPPRPSEQFHEATSTDGGDDDPDDDDEARPEHSVTPEELSLLLQSLEDDEEADEVEAPSP